MSQGLGMHDETAKNLIGSISPLYSATNQNNNHHQGGGNFAERVVAHDDSHELASMWPSSRKPAEKQEVINDDEGEDDLASFWPSQKAA